MTSSLKITPLWTKEEMAAFNKEIYERNKETLSLLQQAIIRFGNTDSAINSHMSDAEAYLMREIYGYELELMKRERDGNA